MILLTPGQYLLLSVIRLVWRLLRALVILLGLLLWNAYAQIERGLRAFHEHKGRLRASRSQPDSAVVPFRRRR
jgi:hypothetical protein